MDLLNLLTVYLVFVLFCLQKTVSKSILNETSDESKFATKEYVDERIKNLTNILADMRKSENEHVFFHVKMASTDVTLNTNSIVKFATVLSNEGNHFNIGDSIFISPVSGTYLFAWTTQAYAGKYVNTELRVDNVIKETLHINLGSSEGRQSVSRSVVCKVKKDDHVWIQTSNHFSENYFDYEYRSQSSFMGVLLF